jgi:hypothetical protein
MAGVFVTPQDYGAVADDTLSGNPSATDNRVPIQRALNALMAAGGGTLFVDGLFAYNDYLVIPSNITILGSNQGSARFRRKNTANSRTIVVGTYGPANSSGPGSETRYDIQDAAIGQPYVTLSSLPSPNPFTVGKIVLIEGAAGTYGGNGFTPYTPNFMTRVTKVSGTTVYLAHNLDDNYVAVTSGTPPVTVSAGIRAFNVGTPSGLDNITTDPVQKWPLFTAENVVIRNMWFDQPTNIGWPNLYLAAYGLVMEDVTCTGGSLAGDPIAYCRFSRITHQFPRAAWEFAYASHDSVITDYIGYRSADTSGGLTVPVVWTNTGEGGKRITFDRFALSDRDDMSFTPTVLGLSSGSQMRNSSISVPKGVVGYLQGNSSITNSILRGNTTADYAVSLLSGSTLARNQIYGGATQTVIIDNNGNAYDNQVGTPGAMRSQDYIYLRNNVTLSTVLRNRTAANRMDEILRRGGSETAIAASSGLISLVDVDISDLILGVAFRLEIDCILRLTGSGTGSVAIVASDGTTETEWLSVPFASVPTPGLVGLATIVGHYNSSSGKAMTWQADLNIGSTSPPTIVPSAGQKTSVDPAPASIRAFGLRIKGATSGDTAAILNYEFRSIPWGSRR